MVTTAEAVDALEEVRYAWDTTLSLPKNSPIFRLKEKYRNLSIDTYSKNLKVYLSKVSSITATTLEDFDDAIIKQQTVNN